MVISECSLLQAIAAPYFLGYKAICSTHLEGTDIRPYKFYPKQMKTLQQINLVVYFLLYPFNPLFILVKVNVLGSWS